METTPESGRHAKDEDRARRWSRAKRHVHARKEGRAKSGSRAATAPIGLGRALLLTAASAVVPGTAHFSRGRLRVALLLFGLFLIAVALTVLALTLPRDRLIHLVLDPAWLLGIMIGTAVLALAWVGNIVWSYTAVRPTDLALRGKFAAWTTVTVLCLLVCAPLALAGNVAQAQRDLLTEIFPNGDSDSGAAAVGERDDPWRPGERLNVLLIGGDADPSRPGVRTDVMVVASVDPESGNTVLLSVPRNMQHTPMPFPALQQRFPNGYPDFLYSLWRYGVQHPQLVPGNSPPDSQRPGAHLLTQTIEEILGIPVNYYALVDLDGFQQLIEALGGVWIDVQEPIRYGEQGQFVVEAGYRALTGREALWYSRSRLESSDYDRMRRQRCMLGAIANQADPITVLRNFRELAGAAKRTVSTNIPRALLPDLVDLAPKVKNATITNFQFVPPVIDTGDPDFAKIRRITQRVIDQSEPSPERSARAEAPAPGETPRATESPSPQPPPGGSKADRQGASGQEEGRSGESAAGNAASRAASIAAACPRITEPGG